MSTAAELYRRAAEVVRSRGLARGVYADRQERVCTLGALGVATVGDPMSGLTLPTELVTPLAELIGGSSPLGAFGVVMNWSDEFGRTVEDVAQLLEHAAEKAEASEVLAP